MNGNIGRAFMTGTNHQSCQQADGGNFLSGSCKAFPKNFSTGAPYNTRQNRMDYNMQHNRFIMGLKNIVNGLISPANNFGLCSIDLNRQKFGNNTMTSVANEIISTRPQTEERLKTVILGLGVGTCSSSQSHLPGSNDNSMDKKSDSEVLAIYASEEFPELQTTEKSHWQPKPNEKCSYFKNNSTHERNMNCHQDAECDSSDDSFVIFADCSPPKCSLSNKRIECIEMCTRGRQRQISECSDDSFVICFTEDAPEGVLEVLSDEDDSDAESESDSDALSDDSEDEDDDQSENYTEDKNQCEHRDETDEIPQFLQKTENNFLTSGETNQPDSGFDEQKPLKRVRFNLKPKVHMMYTWEFAYRASRKGHWEMYARDRDRFQRRIEGLVDILNPVLDSKHREKIYQTRFCDNTSTDKLETLN